MSAKQSKSGERETKVRFFSASLLNGNLMSLPRLQQPQALMGALVHYMEAADPEFAWVQLLFRRANLTSAFVGLKNSIHAGAEQIKTPKRSWIDDSEYDRAELHGDWYRRSGERMKKIDGIATAPHVLLAVQGMWVGPDPKQLLGLPFRDCYDEHDRLGVFVYRNPWMLRELVERRMVTDLSSYFRNYAGSRLEPPSFVATPEEVPYYVHLPLAREKKSLPSLGFEQYVRDTEKGFIEGGKPKGPAVAPRSKILKLAKVPLIGEPLKDKEQEKLGLLPSVAVRGFELTHVPGRTEILLSSHSEEDMGEYAWAFQSVYGALALEPCTEKPPFLEKIPKIVGLDTTPRPHRGSTSWSLRSLFRRNGSNKA